MSKPAEWASKIKTIDHSPQHSSGSYCPGICFPLLTVTAPALTPSTQGNWAQESVDLEKAQGRQ